MEFVGEIFAEDIEVIRNLRVKDGHAFSDSFTVVILVNTAKYIVFCQQSFVGVRILAKKRTPSLWSKVRGPLSILINLTY
jgi:hypothetical protein